MFLIIFIIIFIIYFIISKAFLNNLSNIKIILLLIISFLINSLFLSNLENIGNLLNIEGSKNISIINEIKTNYNEYIKTGKISNKLEDNDNLLRLPTFKELKYYFKISFLEEIIKLSISLINLLIFYIFIDRNINTKIFLGLIFISISGFFLIENLLYFFGTGGNIIILLLRSINPTHYIFFISLLSFYLINKYFNYKYLFISILIGIIFHFFINISITANWSTFSFFLIIISGFFSFIILSIYLINEN